MFNMCGNSARYDGGVALGRVCYQQGLGVLNTKLKKESLTFFINPLKLQHLSKFSISLSQWEVGQYTIQNMKKKKV